MSNRPVTVYQQPSSALPSEQKKKQKRQNKTSAGNVNPRLGSQNTKLTKKELKREIQKDLNITKVTVDGRQRLLYTVPDCTRHYIAARLDPFNTIGGACLPSSDFNFPSLKSKSVSSGTFRLGTSGVGYIAFNPCGANDGQNIAVTSSTSVGTNATALGSFTDVTFYNLSNVPFAGASFGGDLLWRHVASGIRIQYIGSLMNQNGNAFCYVDPDHSSVTNTTSVAQIGNLEGCRRIPITGSTMIQGGVTQNWLCQVIDNGPVVPSEMQFSATPVVQATPYMCICVNGTAGDLYEWEISQHAEYMGKIVPAMTPSHVDNTSWPVVDETIKESYNHGPPQAKEEKSVLARIATGLMEQAPKLISAIGSKLGGLPALVTGLTNLIPMTGHNPLAMGQGMSYPMLMSSQERISSGLGRGSNLFSAPFDDFMRLFAMACVEHQISPLDIVERLVGPEKVNKNFQLTLQHSFKNSFQSIVEVDEDPANVALCKDQKPDWTKVENLQFEVTSHDGAMDIHHDGHVYHVPAPHERKETNDDGDSMRQRVKRMRVEPSEVAKATRLAQSPSLSRHPTL